MERDEMYLTDEQYLFLLDKLLRNPMKMSSGKYRVIDSDTIGNKYTESNVGLCNDNFVAKHTNMRLWKNRSSMKYRENHHLCPYDQRALILLQAIANPEAPMPDVNWFNGCFWTCRIAKRNSLTADVFEPVLDGLITHHKLIEELFRAKILK